MKCRSLIVRTAAVLFPVAGGLSVQQATAEDRDLAVFEARLQEQRATAFRDRFMLYTDELQKLQIQLASAGDIAAAGAVQSELEAARVAMNRLTLIARGQAEPPAAAELKDGDAGNPTALAAKRINTIVASFDRAKTDPAPAADRAPASGQPRQHTLKMERASRNRDYAGHDGVRYWSYRGTYAAWAVDEIVPGDYEVILRYTAGENAGGKAVLKASGQKLEVTIPKSEKGQSQRERRLNAGVVSVKETGVDVRVEHGGLAKGAEYFWDLEAVILQPVTKRP